MSKSKLKQTYSRERLKLVLDSTRLGMWDWNPQNNDVIFDKNWAEMLGLSVDELTMTLDDWSSRVHPDDVDSCMADIGAHLEGKTEFYQNLHRMRHKAGHWVYILDRGKVVERDREGNAVRFTGTHADLTPFKKAEFEASLAIKAKERFFSSMSHELKAPIHAMLGLIKQIQKKVDQKDILEQLEIVDDSGQHLLLIIKDILSAAKMQSGSLSVTPSEFSILGLVRHTAELFQYRATEKKLFLTVKASTDIEQIMVHTDRARLSQVLINLVSNAIKFTEQGGIELEVLENKIGLEIAVRDSGPGIKDTEAVFQPFFTQEYQEQIDGLTSTGLGLGIAKEISDLLNYTLKVESTVGKGSCFSLIIPHADLSVRQKNLASSDTDKNDFSHWPSLSILAVDDIAINLTLLELMLKNTPLKVKTTKSAKKVLELISESHIDVLISDFHMPGMGGLELTTKTRQLTNAHQPIIIISSADGRGDLWPMCQKAGANYYLEKPFEEEDLFELLNTVVLTLQSENASVSDE